MFAQWSWNWSLNATGGLSGRAWWRWRASDPAAPVLIGALADKPPVAPTLNQWYPARHQG